MAANPAIAQAAAKKAAPKTPAAARPTTSVKPAVQRYTGLMAAPLNELSAAEQRSRDVTARREQDAVAYNAFVLGQQGKLAAASAAADHNALRDSAGIQLMAAGANAGSIKGLQDARAAQGITGAVPGQQLGGLVDDQMRSNIILAAGSRTQQEVGQSNQAKAGFLGAASQAGHRAAVARIAGEGAQEQAGIRREKVGLLSQREQIAAEIQAAEEAARADIEKARIAAEERAADRSSRENVAGAQIKARQMEGETDRAFRARQNSLNRRTSVTAARAGAGRRSPSEVRQSARNAGALDSQREQAMALANQYEAALKKRKMWSAETLRAALARKIDNPDPAVLDYVLAAKFKSRAGVTPLDKRGKAKGPTAARRYYARRKQLASGK